MIFNVGMQFPVYSKISFIFYVINFTKLYTIGYNKLRITKYYY